MKDYITANERVFKPESVEKQLLNLIKQHGALIIQECKAGLMISRTSDAKGIGNVINNDVKAKFI